MREEEIYSGENEESIRKTRVWHTGIIREAIGMKINEA